MTDEIRDLIEKINREGIKAAEEKAQNIEAAAQQRAENILSAARIEAEEIIASAHNRIRQEDENERILLAQAGRDFLLSLRTEIQAMLERIVVSDVHQVLSPDEMKKLISEVIRNDRPGEKGDITIFLSENDLERMERNFLQKLGEETRRTITLRPSEEISAGFTISFDSGKSCYEFTDKALAEYIGTYLKPKLNRILQDSIME